MAWYDLHDSSPRNGLRTSYSRRLTVLIGALPSLTRTMNEHIHSVVLLRDVSERVAAAVLEVRGRPDPGTDWDVYGCSQCGWAMIRLGGGERIGPVYIKVPGWNAPPLPPASERRRPVLRWEEVEEARWNR